MLFERSKLAMMRVLAAIPTPHKRAVRLQLDLEDILTGPTCGATAQELARAICRSGTHDEVANRLIEVARRYLAGE